MTLRKGIWTQVQSIQFYNAFQSSEGSVVAQWLASLSGDQKVESSNPEWFMCGSSLNQKGWRPAYGSLCRPPSAPWLVYQRPWHVLPCLCDNACKRSLVSQRNEWQVSSCPYIAYNVLKRDVNMIRSDQISRTESNVVRWLCSQRYSTTK